MAALPARKIVSTRRESHDGYAKDRGNSDSLQFKASRLWVDLLGNGGNILWLWSRGYHEVMKEGRPGANIFTVSGADTALRYSNRPSMPTVLVPRQGYDLCSFIEEQKGTNVEIYICDSDTTIYTRKFKS